MSYLEEFQVILQGEKLTSFLRLWEEYCMAEDVDGEELKKILARVKASPLAPTFGQFIETVLPLYKQLQGQQIADDILRLILDLQTINTPLMADLALDFLKKNYGKQSSFNQKLRIIGLLSRQNFQRAISNYELLTHMDKGNFVFHTGGWGVGEVVDMSLLREHVLLEFEGAAAVKELSFDNAFKNLMPLPSDHFLARRFGNPDGLEAFGRDDPAGLIRLLLKDLGPKTAQEIKEELSELVIPESEWSKWWQAARAKIKKDTMIKAPGSPKEPFILQEEEVPHDVRLKQQFAVTEGLDAQVLLIYSGLRDFPEIMKNSDLKAQFKTALLEGLTASDPLVEKSMARKIEISFLLEDIFPSEFPQAAIHLIKPMENLEKVLGQIEILAFKKRMLGVVRQERGDWVATFLQLLFAPMPGPIRDYIFKELQNDEKADVLLKAKINELLNKMTLFPEVFVWYFQKLVAGDNVPFNDPKGRCQFLEALLILLHFIEDKPHLRDLVKKIHGDLTARRYETVRTLIKDTSLEYLQEFVLLASKCQCFTKHDLKILNSLAEVVQPSLGKNKKVLENEEKVEIIWTTQEGYQKLQEKIQHIGTVETIDNAREIEAARAHGDLRENAEYKFALERRARLQAELHSLSKQLNHVRILTKHDILQNEVSVGSIVHLQDSKEHVIRYTILGPWEADPDLHVLSFQSKFAQAMMGCKEGDSFEFQGEKYRVLLIESFLDGPTTRHN